MTKEELMQLYKEQIIPESKEPYHFKAYSQANLEVKAYNPYCGDKFQIHLQVSDDKLLQGHFEGIGCAVSKASTSILMKQLEGKSKSEVIKICEQFLSALRGESNGKFSEEAMNILVRLMDFDGRVDCIKLSWEAIYRQLSQD